MLKTLQPIAIAPQKIATSEQIRASFHEVLVDINSIVDQWNDTLQPLVNSLPGGRRKITAGERSSTIDPVENGFDGSQVFMDATATPEVYGGFLYNSRLKRQKTIKEVAIDSYSTLSSEIAQLRTLIDAINLIDSTYDDSNIKNWVRRLAADTISDLNEGDAFGTGYFGDPTKTVQYSLHQRDVNLRQVIGLDADYGITSPGFSGTNYIDDDTVLQALIDLDAAVSGVGGVATLQTAYDNGTGAVNITTGKPISIKGSANTDVSLQILGRTLFRYDNAGTPTNVFTMSTAWDAGHQRLLFTNKGIGDTDADTRIEFRHATTFNDTTLLINGANTNGRAEIYGGKSVSSPHWTLGSSTLSTTPTLRSYSDLIISANNEVTITTTGSDLDDGLGIIYQKSVLNYADINGIATGAGLTELGLRKGFTIRDPGDSNTAYAGFVSSNATYGFTASNRSTPAKGIQAAAGKFSALGYAPRGNRDTDGVYTKMGDGICPQLNEIFIDNIIKAKARIECAELGDGAGVRTIWSSYNINPTGTVWDAALGVLTVQLLTPPETNEYTVHATAQLESGDPTAPCICNVIKTGSDTFDIHVKQWNGTNWDFQTQDIHVNFQVV